METDLAICAEHKIAKLVRPQMPRLHAQYKRNGIHDIALACAIRTNHSLSYCRVCEKRMVNRVRPYRDRKKTAKQSKDHAQSKNTINLLMKALCLNRLGDLNENPSRALCFQKFSARTWKFLKGPML